MIKYKELKNLVIGDYIGAGSFRDVYKYKQDDNLVIKCAFDDPQMNILEMEVWEMVKYTEIAKWFAPCISISECGMFLIQKKVETGRKKDYPKKIPAFFSDCKYTNYGWLDNKFVCVDYGSFVSTSLNHKWSQRLKKAEWWG